MQVYHGSYLIFCITDKKVVVKKIVVQIWITAIFAFSSFVPIKIVLSIEMPCGYKGEC